MKLREFVKAGHWPTLACAFFYFDVSFMIWMLMGALGIFISQELGLSAAEKGFLVAVPVLSGAALRLLLGPASDRFGARRVALAAMAVTIVPLLWAAAGMQGFADGIAVGVLLGVAGASFAVALPLASRWYPPEYQGLAMGIAGAGNSGTVLAAFFAPRLAEQIGWRGVFGAALVPLALVLLCFALFAREPQRKPASAGYLQITTNADLWRLNFFYLITFGGFVGLASFLPMFFFDQYGCTRVAAGNWTALCVLAGSFARPLGGALADRVGGVPVLGLIFLIVSNLVLLVAQLPPLPVAIPLLVTLMLTLGMGNGTVFQLVGQRFPHTVGVATGMIGAAGGFGGFLLPSILGTMKQSSGSYASGLIIYAAGVTLAAFALTLAQRRWGERRTVAADVVA